MSVAAGMRAIRAVLLLSALGFGQQASVSSPARSPSERTLFVDFGECHENEKPRQVLSPVSLSADGRWRAYVEVELNSEFGCTQTTRLWVARENSSYRLVYLIPPTPDALGNGMEILGWDKNSRMILVRTEEWQWGSDALDTQRILAIEAATGIVHDLNLPEMLEGNKNKRCVYRVQNAGFAADERVHILVRVEFHTALDADDDEENVPPEKRCGDFQETWSFAYGAPEVKQAPNTELLQLFGKFLPDRPNN